MVDARIQFGLQQPDILASLTKGFDLAQQIRNAPILDRLLQQRETQGQQAIAQGEQKITQTEQEQALQAAQLQGRVGVALLGMEDIEDRRAFLNQVAPILIQAGTDPEEIQAFPIDDDERIRELVDQAQTLFPQKTIGSPVIGQLEGGGFGFATMTPGGGRVTPVPGFTPTGTGGETPSQKESRRLREAQRKQDIATGGFQETQDIRLETDPEIAAATTTARTAAEAKARDLAGAEARIIGSDTQIEKIDSVMEEVEAALGLVAPSTTGFIGARTAGIEGTDAFSLAAKIDTIQANLGFKELQDMRAASKTGGALGQVSERELSLLVAAMVSLKQGLPEKELRRSLEKVLRHYNNWKVNVAKIRARDVKLLGRDPASVSEMTDEEILQSLQR